MARRNRPWLIYALGGGWGHLTRAASLARAAKQRHRVRVLSNSQYARQVASATPELDLVALDPSLEAAEVRRRVIEEIEVFDPGCLIVDTFPRGLGGELAGLIASMTATRVLVHRDLSPRYVAQCGLRSFVQSVYDLILIPGENEAGVFADLPAARITKPWLIRDPTPRQRRGKYSVLVCASGNATELAWYGATVSNLQTLYPSVDVRCVAPVCPPGCLKDCWIAHWPAADLYPAARVVIGGAGYNTIHECLCWEIPLIARPWPRKYDRQWLRARRAAKLGSVRIVKTPEEAAHAAVRQLKELRVRRRIVSFENGTIEAAALIEHACARAFSAPPFRSAYP